MKNSKQKFPEGTWFAVPLRNGGFARGVVARTTGKGATFGYFFGPKTDDLESLPSFADLRPDDAVLIGQFGDRGLIEGAWEAIGRTDNWDRNAWPLPSFVRVDENAGKAWKATYSDELEVVTDEPCDPSLATEYPSDRLMGYGSVEIKLTRLLDSTPAQ